ncbi:MAG: lysylphosphatidylglycerol synthase transmembrane domain-containing protein [Trebonia sp.]
MATVASETAPGTRHPLAQRLRAAALGPHGGGTTRRRASDVFRLGLAIVVVAVSVPVMQANSAAELRIVRFMHPPPAAISWLVTSVFWLGSAGVIGLLVIVGLLVPRLTAIRWTAVAAVLTVAVCALLSVVLGPAGGRPPAEELAGVNTGYPVTELAVTIAMAATAVPYLSRPLHRTVSFLITLAVLAAICAGQALPVNAISSVALGWGVAAALHLVTGSPVGLLSSAEVTDWIADLKVAVGDITRAPRQVWGVERFAGRDPAGSQIELSVYGRDASDARVLAKVWRFAVYRDSGPTLILDRLQQVEHEAYLTLMAERAGVLVPDVLAAGQFGPSGDAALVTRVPDGPVLAQATETDLTDRTLDEILLAVLRMRATGIAHGALGADTIVISEQGVCIRDFRRATASAPASRVDTDLAAVLAAVAVRAGPERTAAAAARVLDAATARGALVHLQRSALDPDTVGVLQGRKELLPRLREEVASGVGIEVPRLAEEKRISWTNLVFGIGSLIGLWAIIGILSGAGSSLEAIKGASWGWVAVTFVLAQLPMLLGGLVLMGSATGDLPFGRCVALETSNAFTALVGGDVAVFAIRVRFFQRQGYEPAEAVSAGAIATTAWWVVKALLFIVALPFAAGDFKAASGESGDQKIVWIVLLIVLAAGVIAAVITLVPRLRRLASSRVRPYLVSIWANLKTIAVEPRKMTYVLVGTTVAQLLSTLALGAALHAVGEQASIATLLTVNTLAGLIGGAIPVPGGAGVVEAGLIAGLVSAGIPQDQAVAAVLIQRFFTTYLPPVWGWLTLAWMRRREYV